MGEGDTFLNAVIGAVATVVVSGFIPFGPVAGGAVAGYLQGGDRSDGTRVGAISGLIAFVPALLIGFLVVSVFLAVVFSGNAGLPFGFGALGIVGFLFIAAVGAVYFVGLSALGGYLGNYVRYDTDVDL